MGFVEVLFFSVLIIFLVVAAIRIKPEVCDHEYEFIKQSKLYYTEEHIPYRVDNVYECIKCKNVKRVDTEV